MSIGPQCIVESLETRQMLAVSLDADGWTVVTPSADSRLVYVSSSAGDDANSGLSVDGPVRTLDRAALLARPGKPDHILLKRADTWTDQLFIRGGGRSNQEPLLIGSYGEGPRPLIRAATGRGGLETDGRAPPMSHIVINDIWFKGPGDNSYTVGIEFLTPTTDLLIENVRVSKFRMGIVIQGLGGRHSDVRLRRNVIHDNANTIGADSSGAYFARVDGLRLEENIFDHNGWRTEADAHFRSHNFYIQGPLTGDSPADACSNVTVVRNISLRAAAQAMSIRPATPGVVKDNLVALSPIGIYYAGVGGTVSRNTIVEGIARPMDDAWIPAWGLTGAYRGTSLKNNVVANVAQPDPDNYNVIAYDIGAAPLAWVGNVAYKWANGGGKPANVIGGLSEPTRTFTAYAAVMGYADIFASLRAMERGNWDPDLTAVAINTWIRAGFAYDATPNAITGRVYFDHDTDGTRDPGDEGLANWVVYLDQDLDGRLDAGEPRTTTAADGTYSFTGLPAGYYRVRQVPKLDWPQTTAKRSFGLRLLGGQTVSANDFGNRPATSP